MIITGLQGEARRLSKAGMQSLKSWDKHLAVEARSKVWLVKTISGDGTNDKASDEGHRCTEVGGGDNGC